MPDNDPTPEEIAAEDAKHHAAQEESRKKLDAAIKSAAEPLAKGEISAEFHRAQVAKAAVTYAICNNIDLLDEAEPVFKGQFEARARLDENKS